MCLHLNMDITINDFSFRANLGKNIIKKIYKEFNYDKTRTDKFAQLFEDTFVSNLDKETVVDINKKRNFIFSNTNFPEVKYQHIFKMTETESVARTLINECSRIFGEGENSLFKVILGKYLSNGKTPEELKELAKNIITPKSKKSFLEKIKVAERIKKEYPDTKYSKDEFTYIENLMLQEEAETPGTELYNLVHSLDELELDFSV